VTLHAESLVEGHRPILSADCGRCAAIAVAYRPGADRTPTSPAAAGAATMVRRRADMSA
jgi:hypothetical protein